MKTLRNIFLIFTIFILSNSCTEEFLKPDPLSFFSPENVYIDAAGFEALLITMRKDLKEENYEYNNNFMLEYSASDLASPWSQLDFFELTPSASQYYNYLGMFEETYEAIKNTNVLISRIDDVEWDSEELKMSKLAQALWYRSYWYYRLIHTYGDVPFLAEEITEPRLDFYTHSRAAILTKIQADMETAVKWLQVEANPGEITKGAANHLLTKIYLANSEFDKAIASASEVIDGPYALMTNRFGSWKDDANRNVIWDLHRPENMSLSENTEVILASVDRYEAPDNAKTAGLYTMRIYGPAWHHSTMKDSEGKAGMVTEIDGKFTAMYDSLGRGNANVRLTYFYQYNLWKSEESAPEEYTWENTPDLRRSDINWVDLDEYLYNNPASVDYGKPIDISLLPAQVDTFHKIYAVPHYILYVPQKNPAARPMGGNGDWAVFRLADTYLLRAEAYYWKNKMGDAANDLNKVRERSNADPISASDVTIDFIFDERARELMAESPRHSELVRASYIMAKNNLNGYTLDNFSNKNYYYDVVMEHNLAYGSGLTLLGHEARMDPFHVYWPIPADVILANTLGVINQNIGYFGDDKNVPPLEKIEEVETTTE